MVTEAREKHKITAVQVRKIYELLRLRATDISNAEEYKKYRLEVKRRLNIPFQKEKKSLQKLEKFLQPQVDLFISWFFLLLCFYIDLLLHLKSEC